MKIYTTLIDHWSVKLRYSTYEDTCDIDRSSIGQVVMLNIWKYVQHQLRLIIDQSNYDARHMNACVTSTYQRPHLCNDVTREQCRTIGGVNMLRNYRSK